MIEELRLRNYYNELYNLIDSLIKNNIDDINTTRASRSTASARNYVFPYIPEKTDDNYPRIVIQFITTETAHYGNADFIEEVYDTSNELAKEVYGVYNTVKVVISVFVKRGQLHSIQNFDGSVVQAQNALQSDFLALKIQNMLRKNSAKFHEKRFDIDSKDIVMTPSYDSGSFNWVSEISFPVSVIDLWEDYTNPADIIRTINLSENVS